LLLSDLPRAIEEYLDDQDLQLVELFVVRHPLMGTLPVDRICGVNVSAEALLLSVGVAAFAERQSLSLIPAFSVGELIGVDVVLTCGGGVPHLIQCLLDNELRL
jgi:hypothetical protein